jgi:hypothetical protein
MEESFYFTECLFARAHKKSLEAQAVFMLTLVELSRAGFAIIQAGTGATKLQRPG